MKGKQQRSVVCSGLATVGMWELLQLPADAPVDFIVVIRKHTILVWGMARGCLQLLCAIAEMWSRA